MRNRVTWIGATLELCPGLLPAYICVYDVGTWFRNNLSAQYGLVLHSWVWTQSHFLISQLPLTHCSNQQTFAMWCVGNQWEYKILLIVIKFFDCTMILPKEKTFVSSKALLNGTWNSTQCYRYRALTGENADEDTKATSHSNWKQWDVASKSNSGARERPIGGYDKRNSRTRRCWKTT